MTNQVANPFYKNPWVVQIGSNLARAFMGDEGRGVAYREHARLYKAQADKAERENVAHSQIGTLIKGYNGTSPVAAEWLANAYGTALQAGVKPSDVSNLVLGLVANSGRPTGEVAKAWTGAGHATGKDTAFGVEDRERVAARENSEALKRTSTSAGIAANASITNNRDRIQYEKDNPTKDRVEGTALNTYLKDNPNSVGGLFFKPDHVPQGAHVAPAPGDPRYPQGGGVPAPKPPTADRFVQTEDPNRPGSNLWQPVAPNLPGPAKTEKAPVDPAASASMLNTIELNVLGNVGGWDANLKAPKPEFIQQYGARMVDAKKRAGDVYQKTKNAGEAERAYLEGLGIKPGETLEYPGVVGRLFGVGPKLKPAEGVLPPTAPTDNIAAQFAPKPPSAPAAPTAPAAQADTLPPEAASALKEGVHTQFGNGQTWTLQNGAPVRVQ